MNQTRSRKTNKRVRKLPDHTMKAKSMKWGKIKIQSGIHNIQSLGNIGWNTLSEHLTICEWELQSLITEYGDKAGVSDLKVRLT